MTAIRRRATFVGVIAAFALLAACSPKEPPMQIKDVPATEDMVRQYAAATLTASGQAAFSQSNVSPAPCEGRAGELSDTVYYVQGAYQLLVPVPDQLALITKVQQDWQRRGYTITAQRTFPDTGGGEVKATDPTDGVTLTIGSGETTAVFLLIYSPCYQRPV